MFIYQQATGRLLHNEKLLAVGYSGFREGKNNPGMQGVVRVGPIPVGWYAIGETVDSPSKGPVVIRLYPHKTTRIFGRSGFLIHGDSLGNPGEASHGCIIVPRDVRKYITASSDRQLQVVSGLEEYRAETL